MHRDEQSLRLVEMIYRTALDPRDYDEFMVQWHDWMDARLEDLTALQQTDPTMSSPEVAAHFELALRLIERMGDPPEHTAGTGPRMLVDREGHVLWQNAEADRRFGNGKRPSIFTKDMSDDHRSRLSAVLARLSDDIVPEPIVVQITPTDGTRPAAFRVEPMRKDRAETVALLSALTPPWPSATDRLLVETHGLSDSECAICALVADGISPAAISQRRGTSVATVRTQIKRIQAKTQTSTQTELAAHLHALQRVAETMPAPDPVMELPPPVHGQVSEEMINGRRMPVEEHGPAEGRPVIFLHGMLDGTGTTGRIWQELRAKNLRLICPHRPAFGRSDADTGPVDSSPARLARDIQELIKLRRIERPVVVGHMAGAVYAPDVARACNARGIVNVSGGVPILSNQQFDSMSRRQRLVAYTARYARSVLPFVLNAGIRQIKSGGAETFLASLYENAPVDNELLKDPEIRTMILNGYRFSVAQGNKAFTIDSQHVVLDWTPRFEASAPIPVKLIHGQHDPVVAVDSVRDFADRHAERVELEVVDDAGQLVFYQSPGLVLGAIARFFDEA